MAKIYLDDVKLNVARNKIFSSLISHEQHNFFDVIKLLSGDYLPTQKMINGNYKVYGGGGITDKTHNDFNVTFETLGIGRVGARCGCVFKIESKSWVTDNALFASEIDKNYDLDFLIHFLNFKNINQLANTAAQPVISQKRISVITIPKVDLDTQKEIVVLLNNIEQGIIKLGDDRFDVGSTLNFVESNELLSTELTHQLDLVKKLRQQLLQDAVQGKLVPQNPNDEPAGELLKKIKAEKAKLVAEKKLKKEKELPPIQPEEIPFTIPDNWVWCTIPEIAANEKHALKAGPFGSSLKKEYYVNTGYKIYGQEQVIKQDPFFGNYYINEDRFKLLKSCRVKEGDILISLVGTMGKVLILPDNIEDGIINPRLVKLTLYKSINRKYIKWFLYSTVAIKQINNYSHGSTMDIINLGIINKLLIPLPPLSEQTRIVQKVDELMQYCNELEASIKHSQQQNEKLLQQILREALRPPASAAGKEPVGV